MGGTETTNETALLDIHVDVDLLLSKFVFHLGVGAQNPGSQCVRHPFICMKGTLDD